MSAWPTLVMIDPEGYVVGAGAGEFTSESLAPLIVFLIQKSESKGTFKHRAMTVAPDPPTVAPGRLRYPGKVAVQGSRIAIADSGNDRVLTGKLSIDGQSMTVELVAGSGKRGYDNGWSASFNSPQGLAFAERTLYVADAGNHAVRAIDLGSGEVSTVAGTGRQLRTRADREGGALSSDDCLSPTPTTMR